MTIIKAKKRDNPPVTEELLAQALARGSKRAGAALQATEVEYLPAFAAIAIGFADKTAVLLPIDNYPELAELSAAELGRIELGYAGSALCLEERDLHVSIAGLVAASPALMKLASTVVATRNGSRSSEAKVLAVRENGKKGGRPRKLPQDV
ncbi:MULTISPECIES: DUF2442 domain-containing protein [unclassified Herbaspirillum]|uniref:DUF2442 domain-containing protein n=1 Tax=unclassified Herbaspirillum TaxID=2624150 RepID=UPI000981DB3A|nr:MULTISPECIES: DUF2442 domain-containing protein [unclassified Herbaspirillum]MCI1013347.1 DUF2442 domain-containing protein [Herbaspirillum sp. C7C2]ONN67995.1 hypothetical protein BTM36_03020 [Herbaspirillum sp. VT-16-41]